MRLGLGLLWGLLFVLLAGCDDDPAKGPKSVDWRNETCERCRMFLADRRFAAQVRYFPTHAAASEVVVFDDIGCAILWLEDKPWKTDPHSEIWVVDQATGNWIDARRAGYLRGAPSPMGYGLAAREALRSDALDFEQARRYVLETEAKFAEHDLHLLRRLREQSRQRQRDLKARAEDEALPSIVAPGG